MATYDVETLVLSVGVRARATSVRHNELVEQAKGITCLYRDGHIGTLLIS